MKNIDNIEEIKKGLVQLGYEDLCKEVLKLAKPDGLFLEFGVAQGGSLKRIAELAPSQLFHGFDSFEGLPEQWRDMGKGTFSCSIPTMPDNVILHVGLFENTIPKFVDIHSNDVISFINIDCDLYSSTKSIFNHLGNQIVPGTLIRFDEIYHYEGWREHEYKAFKEFLDEKNYDCEFLFQDGIEQALVRVIGM